jgi:hypothetical protein
MLTKIKNYFRKFNILLEKIDFISESLGRIENRQVQSLLKSNPQTNLEFKIYSQSGEDGIIQWLINKIDIKNKTFIEFGVENYLESNTRFLLLNNYWSGLIIDGDIENINFIKKDPIYWRCNLKAVSNFITKDNVDEIFLSNGLSGEIGLLSIDVDGNDYWIFESISSVNPAIIVAEYNSFFGYKRKVTVPYDKSFVRSKAHYSKTYYGASINALTSLANLKGYKLVASNRSGNNVFFVRNDLMNGLNEMSVKDAYRQINFRESHNISGELTFSSFEDSKKIMNDLDVFDVETNKFMKIKDL